jgi:putative redox protein
MADHLVVELTHAQGSVSEAAIRSHRVLIDRPASKGGSDEGPMGGELFLASVGGCFLSNLLAAVKAREAPVSDISLRVTGTLEPSPTRFTGVALELSARCDDREALDKLIEIAWRGCIMINTLQGKLDVTIHLAD